MEYKQFTGEGLFFLWFCLEKAAEMFLISSHNLTCGVKISCVLFKICSNTFQAVTFL
jgi:hypothetical protein